jgi:hypothetical protein
MFPRAWHRCVQALARNDRRRLSNRAAVFDAATSPAAAIVLVKIGDASGRARGGLACQQEMPFTYLRQLAQCCPPAIDTNGGPMSMWM